LVSNYFSVHLHYGSNEATDKNLQKMKTTIQVVENSDRFHVSENGVPHQTFTLFNSVRMQDLKYDATQAALRLCSERLNEGFTVTMKPIEKK
jgi:hypothetical protein